MRLDLFYVLSALWSGIGEGSPVCPLNPHALLRVTSEAAWVSPSAMAAGVAAFVNVNVVPLDTERVLSNQTVVVQDGRITALGPSNEISVPAGAVRIDGRDKYLIPGLGDMHGHFAEKDDSISVASYRLFSYLANGVTTVRQIINQNQPHRLQVFQHLKSPDIIGARFYAPGRVDLQAVKPESVAAYAAAFKANGHDHVMISGREIRASPLIDSVLAAIRRLGLPIASHFHEELLGDIPALGVHDGSLDHLYAFRDILSRPETEVSAEEIRAAALTAQRTWITPTLACKEQRDRPRGSLLTARRITKALQDAGGRLLLGADADGINGLSPSLVHEELQALVRAGLSPYQALLTGTRNIAEYFGVLDSAGTVTVGKRADLVLLNGNPLADIRHTIEPSGVMRNGRWLDRVALDQRLLASPKEWLEWEVWWGMMPRMSREQKERGGHFERFGTLADSLAAAGPSDAARLVRVMTDELGAIRANLTPAQHATFDPKARVWMRTQAQKGYKVVVAGVSAVP